MLTADVGAMRAIEYCGTPNGDLPRGKSYPVAKGGIEPPIQGFSVSARQLVATNGHTQSHVDQRFAIYHLLRLVATVDDLLRPVGSEIPIKRRSESETKRGNAAAKRDA